MQPTTRIAVQVTFLRMDQPNPAPRSLPPDTDLVKLDHCSVAFYRYLYGAVGGPYMWWLRRSLPDEAIASILRSPAVSVHVLYRGGEPAGFFELDASPRPFVNLSYFGLVPGAIGLGLGRAFLDTALARAWSLGARSVTVNTCTADHPRAMPNYLNAGFNVLRSMHEVWDIPNRLGMEIPPQLHV